MQNRTFTLAYLMVLMIGMPCPGAAQDTGAEQPSAREQLQHIYTPQSIDQELARLTKDLELTREQQPRVRPLLVEHHDRIQVLLDENPKASRQELGPQDSHYQRRDAPKDSCLAFGSPEGIGKRDAATRAYGRRKQTIRSASRFLVTTITLATPESGYKKVIQKDLARRLGRQAFPFDPHLLRQQIS
jgi:hypothetical protein